MAKKHFLLKNKTYINLTAISRIDLSDDVANNQADLTIFGKGLDKGGVNITTTLGEGEEFLKAWKEAIK